MKKKLFLLAFIATLSIGYAYASEELVAGGCGVPQCGGGSRTCCTDANQNTFYIE